MSEQAFIDGLRFAQEHKHLQGRVAISNMARLADVVSEQSGCAEFNLAGSVGRNSRAVIEVDVRATLALTCQRCLERFDYALVRRSRLLLIPDGDQLPDVGNEDPDTEALPASAVANVADLIEQEILLGLPLSPVHPDGQCKNEVAGKNEGPSSPFAVLAGLKSS